MNVLDQVCDSLQAVTKEPDSARYAMVLPRSGRAFVGLGLSRRILLSSKEIITETGAGTITQQRGAGDPVRAVAERLDPTRPAFWIIGPDLRGTDITMGLPLLACIQPREELCLTGQIVPHDVPIAPPLCDPRGWRTESDTAFRGRIARGLEILSDWPDGKLILSRTYDRPWPENADPLELFRLMAGSEPDAACSHFASIAPGFVSLGCSPENVLETDGDRVTFDVVAGTRGKSADAGRDRRWREELLTSPKERHEHRLALARCHSRLRAICAENSIRADRQLELLELGRVRHLWSRMSGQLADGSSWLDLLCGSLPALSSYPAELRRRAGGDRSFRGYYGGVIGRTAPGGIAAEFFLNLRALLCHRDTLMMQGGIGLVAGADPDGEVLEVHNKLSGLLSAVEQWLSV